ncbi:hypothetical protein LZ32DRAFT_197720 [Colletotrichum eremochloae]|nr:hypothetical protein LZ32DRAFT_197720 [Colletotrichum eremochloae]
MPTSKASMGCFLPANPLNQHTIGQREQRPPHMHGHADWARDVSTKGCKHHGRVCAKITIVRLHWPREVQMLWLPDWPGYQRTLALPPLYPQISQTCIRWTRLSSIFVGSSTARTSGLRFLVPVQLQAIGKNKYSIRLRGCLRVGPIHYSLSIDGRQIRRYSSGARAELRSCNPENGSFCQEGHAL